MALLGDDGRGYELARKLESHGVWRSWLGDALYSAFIHFLSSPAAWDAFMRADDSKTKPQIQLQLRVRALLFDKAAFSSCTQSSLHPPISNLSADYLELHGDDVYFTLENGAQDGDQRRVGFVPSNGKGFSHEELPETWYSQFFEKYRASKSYRSIFGDRESEKRTPEQMSMYLKVLENHKRRRMAFKDNASSCSNSVMGEHVAADETLFFPETMFAVNCVPDGAVLQTTGTQINQKVPFNGVLDNLPQIISKSPVINPIMIERLGIRPEYLNMEQGHQNRGKGASGNQKLLGQEQASQQAQKVVTRMLSSVGFESSSDVPLKILAEFMSNHIGKLGRNLKLLSDSYKKQCSAIELLKMFLQMAGYSNLGTLTELVKDTTKNVVIQHTQQQVLGMQAQLQSQLQPTIQQTQQILRQMSPQMQQMTNAQILAFQQQQLMRRRQPATPRPTMSMNMNIDKDRPMVQVKLENPDFSLDPTAFTTMNARNPQFQQLRQQQLAAISSLHAQANNAFRPMNSLPIPQVQSPNMGMARAPPVKVEGFQDLIGSDSSGKHDSEENKLLSPQK